MRIVKRPWIGVAVCVLVCAALAAQAVGHVIEAQVLAASPNAPKIPRVIDPTPAPAAPAIDRVAEGTTLVSRDMFCSSCAPVAPPKPEPGGVETGVPLTSLPFILIATSLGHDPIATVRDDHSGSQGAFALGETLPGAGSITRIGATYVDFMNPAASREERVSLLAVATGGPPQPQPVTTQTAGAFDDRVRKVDDTHFEVTRSLIKELVGAAGKPVPGVRMMPMSKDGKLSGVRVLSARPDSVAGALGLKSGDTLGAVNGVQIDSLDKMLEVYSKIDELNVVAIDGTRGGKPITFEYKLR
ncbi:MAG TPA: type II secretion system protein GspC, partial [Kofleriaceae bacterium]|nr:type II secretion system protein GspC [Kofleriaceae bacterium]